MRNKAIINLNTIKNNAKIIKKRIKGALFCAVVKDDAYGHGAVSVANAIYPLVDSYAVSLVEEGIELRNGGIDKDILVLIPCKKEDIERAILYNLTLSVESFSELKQIKKVCVLLNRKVKIHIQFNSGMNRCGTKSVDEVVHICKYAKYSKCIYVDGIYSHLGKPEDKKLLLEQVNNFLLAKNESLVYNKKIKAHISASGGVIKNQNFNMVRVGLLLYGYSPFKSDIKVRPAMRIEVPVIKNITLKSNERALYGLKTTNKEMNLSLVRLGYGDGVFRKNIKGQFSNRCMDMSLIDSSLKKGNKYIISDFDALAKLYHTIPYEIMVNISKRCERIYIK